MSGSAIAEGGDIFWVDNKTIAIGKGFRTNQEGIDQIKYLFNAFDVTVFSFDLPFFRGSEACLHMMSLISVVDDKKALIYKSLLPIALVQLLEEKNYTLIEAPRG